MYNSDSDLPEQCLPMWPFMTVFFTFDFSSLIKALGLFVYLTTVQSVLIGRRVPLAPPPSRELLYVARPKADLAWEIIEDTKINGFWTDDTRRFRRRLRKKWSIMATDRL